MRVQWQFDRGKAEIGQPIPVKCMFAVGDDAGTQTVLEFVIPEEAAQQMLENLANVAKPPAERLTIARIVPTDGSIT